MKSHDEAVAIVDRILEQTIYNVLYGMEEQGDRSFREHFMDAYTSTIAAALDARARETWLKAAKLALEEEEPEGDPPRYIQQRMEQASIGDNVCAAVRATKKSIATVLRAQAAARGGGG